jgi:polar amino acid transport system ATP-binding protein
MGPSGSGKSTFLQCAAGLDRPTSGSIYLGEVELGGLSENALSRLRRETVGFVFQSFNLIPSLTTTQNITLPLRLAKREPEKEWLAEVTERVGLTKRAKHRPGELSGGQQQRVAIARALAMSPTLMLLDEITSALDPQLVSEVLNLVRELANTGMTMIVATHEMGFARDVADKICFLDAGVILEEGPPSQIFGDPQEERTRAFLSSVLSAGRL